MRYYASRNIAYRSIFRSIAAMRADDYATQVMPISDKGLPRTEKAACHFYAATPTDDAALPRAIYGSILSASQRLDES